MLIAEKQVTSMLLPRRVAEFQAIVASAQITDAIGVLVSQEDALLRMLVLLRNLRGNKGTLYFVGNGGSASIASHAVTDFVNVASLPATTLHDSSLLTCMANDYGYDQAFERILDTVAKPGDMLVAISSSGRSKNIRNAAAKMRDVGGAVITLSGFDEDNPLRTLGDLNVWLASHDYGFVEIGHQFVLHNLADRLRIEKESSR
jgi:D-sedoheptulose 7-phosphate isomerase